MHTATRTAAGRVSPPSGAWLAALASPWSLQRASARVANGMPSVAIRIVSTHKRTRGQDFVKSDQ